MLWKYVSHPLAWIAAAIIATAVAVVFWYVSQSTTPAVLRPEASAPAPGFSLPGVDGPPASLSQFKGKVVLLNFWTTDCPPCVDQITALIRLRTRYPGDLVILGIAVDTTEARVRSAISNLNINYPVLLGDADVANDYPGPGLPRSYLIDREGRIRAVATAPLKDAYRYFFDAVAAVYR